MDAAAISGVALASIAAVDGVAVADVAAVDGVLLPVASGLSGRTWGFVTPHLCVSEMEIRGSPGGADLTSPGGQTVGCDTIGYWQSPSTMFDDSDGDFGYGYLGDSGTDWLQVDFGSAVNVAEFAIKPLRSGSTVIGSTEMTYIEVWRADFGFTAALPSLANGWTYVTTFSSISGWAASTWKVFTLP